MSYTNRAKMKIIRGQINTLLANRTLEPFPPSVGPGFFSRIIVVPKKSKRLHQIISLNVLNEVLKPKGFKMEYAESLRAALLPRM